MVTAPTWLISAHAAILVFGCIQITLSMLVVVCQTLHKRFVHQLPPRLGEYPAISVIVPTYLPNEASIIQHTLEHILRIDYPGQLTLWCIYNTSCPMPEEEAGLAHVAAGPLPAGRRVELVNTSSISSSKAENLNIAIAQYVNDPLVAVYDADHRPYHDALRLLVETQAQTRADCVQGTICIRTRPSVLAKLVCAEMFAQQVVYFPHMAAICNTAFYGGSNAVWRTEALREYPFREQMMAEDIDVSSRAVFDGKRIVMCVEARSSELPTRDVWALLKQRRRWGAPHRRHTSNRRRKHGPVPPTLRLTRRIRTATQLSAGTRWHCRRCGSRGAARAAASPCSATRMPPTRQHRAKTAARRWNHRRRRAGCAPWLSSRWDGT